MLELLLLLWIQSREQSFFRFLFGYALGMLTKVLWVRREQLEHEQLGTENQAELLLFPKDDMKASSQLSDDRQENISLCHL